MGFKKTSRSMDFADVALANCLEQNRSINLEDCCVIPSGSFHRLLSLGGRIINAASRAEFSLKRLSFFPDRPSWTVRIDFQS